MQRVSAVPRSKAELKKEFLRMVTLILNGDEIEEV
jgi:hypothetical protein